MLHLKMIIRSWWRNKLSTIISVASLTTGLVCSTMLILFVIGEYRIANSQGASKNVYILEQNNPFVEDKNIQTSATLPNAAYELKESYPEIEKYVTLMSCNWRLDNSLTTSNYNHDIYAVTPDFLDFFKIKVLEGDLRSTLQSENEIAVTQNFMRTKFGRDAVIGDRFTAESGHGNWVNGKPIPISKYDVTITSIIDDEQNTFLNIKALTKLPVSIVEKFEGYSFTNYVSFVKIHPQHTGEELEKKVEADSTISEFHKVTFKPLSQVYLDNSPRSDRGDSNLIVRRDPTLLTIGLTVALAVLLIAAFNYINITMTRARSRLRNIAGQRIFGASKWNVRFQTILDTSLTVLLSFALSLIIINTFTPQFNSFMNCNVSLYDLLRSPDIFFVSGLLLILIIAPSVYILVKIDVANPINSFKNPLGSKSTISNVMIIAQFIISIVLIAVSININRQLDFIVSQRPNSESIITIKDGSVNELQQDFVDRVSAKAGVVSKVNSGPLPGNSNSNNGIVINGLFGSPEIFDFYEMELIEGRKFNDADSTNRVVVNETLLKILAFEEPYIGKTFDFNGMNRMIVGIVRDFMYVDAHKPIQALAIVKKDYNDNWILSLKLSGDIDKHIEDVKQIWKETNPQGGSLQVETVADIYAKMHPMETRLRTMVDIFMFISMLLTALGLFGLSFYTVGRRSKEIAVRKIHGSTTSQVIILLCRTFIIWFATAVVIALPIAYYLSNEWLSTFIFRVSTSPWVFVSTIVITMIITLLTVIFQTWKAASANPANSIKSE